MKWRNRVVIVCLAGQLAAIAQSGDASFQSALRELAAQNYAAALPHLEQAVAADPENVRYSNEYRQAAIQAKEYDRAVTFFEKLVADHPASANTHLNYGFAFVDKIPAAGSISQVILASNALTEFSKTVELNPSWIAYYTRGSSYLFWPKVFNRTRLGVADLQHAMDLQAADRKHRSYYVRTYIALGDAYWKGDEFAKAAATWEAGLKAFPDSTALKQRLSLTGEQLKTFMDETYDPSKRVNTDLKELWSDQ